MPLEWEKLVPQVQTKLKMLSEVYPQWKNWREQLLVRGVRTDDLEHVPLTWHAGQCLHEVNYDIDEV